MDRYAFLADLVTLAADCVGNAAGGCQYEIFVSPGQPPADCSHIAGYWTGVRPTRDAQQGCVLPVQESFTISLNRCCQQNNGTEFDPALEDEDARCFIKDFGALVDCLMCRVPEVLSNYVRTPKQVVVSTGEPDQMSAGGCYGGLINISFVRVQPCCVTP